MNQARAVEIAGILDDEERPAEFAAAKRTLQILLAQQSEAVFFVSSKHFRIATAGAAGRALLIQPRCHPRQVAQLSRSLDGGVGAENFLDERRACSWHSHDEDGAARLAARATTLTNKPSSI